MTELTFAAAFLAGLFGSLHCLGMCGGIAGALGMSVCRPGSGKGTPLAYAVSYNLGRVAGYALLGAVVGTIGMMAQTGMELAGIGHILRAATGVILILIGIQIAASWRGPSWLEHAGIKIWKAMAPITRPLFPPRNLGSTFALGLTWGFLPCGLVYSMLLAAMLTGGTLEGAGFMAAFGAGTLPAMIAISGVATQVDRLRRNKNFRRGLGALMVLFGVWTLIAPWLLQAGLIPPYLCLTPV